MAKKSSNSSPLTFDLPVDLIVKVEACRQAQDLRSISEVVRAALAGFDFNCFHASRSEHRQISVRLPEAMKERLAKYSQKKKVSVGELLRVAINNFETKPAKKGAAKSGKSRKKR